MTSRHLVASLAALLALTGVFVACGEDEPTPTSTPPVTAVEPPEVPPAPAEARPSWDEPNFALTATAAGPYVAGTAGAFALDLTPRGPYHVNLEYPWSVTVTTPTGVTTPAAMIEPAGMQLTQTSAHIAVPFTADSAGTHQITCAVDFGICTEEGCVFETRNVAVDVTVAAVGALVPGVGVPEGAAPEAAAPEAAAPGAAPPAPAPGAAVPPVGDLGRAGS